MALRNEHTLGASNQQQGTMTARARDLQSLGNLSSINAETRSIPVPISYLNPTSVPGSSAPRYGPPPLPPRRPGMYPSSYNRMGGMGGMYSPYSPYSRYPSFGYSSPYSGYRMGSYGQYGPPNDSGNSFIQMAEESTRPAFESIESVVEVVSSISMMLESTYHAVHSSYSAILGVVDQFSRLKDHLAQILSVLALLRGLRWLCFKVLYLLGLRKDNPSVEAAWNSAECVAGSSNTPTMPGDAQASAWPFLMFVGLVIGAPWLMFKLLSKSVTKKGFDQSKFVDGTGKTHVVFATHDFKATQPGELSFRAGEKLYLAINKNHHNKGWFLACNEKKETGLIPYTYLVTKRQSNARNAMQVESFPSHASIAEDTPLQMTVPSTELQDVSSIPQTPVAVPQTPVDLSEDALNNKVFDEEAKINN